MNIETWISEALNSGRDPEELAKTFVAALNDAEQKRTKEQNDSKRNEFTRPLYQKAQNDMKLGGKNVTDTTLASLATHLFMKKFPEATIEQGNEFYKNIVEVIYDYGKSLTAGPIGNSSGTITKLVKEACKPLKVEIEKLSEEDVENAIEKFLREFHIL